MIPQTTCAPILRLLGLDSRTAPRDFVLDRSVTLLGREPCCDLVLPLASVSRRHARIVRLDDQYRLEDLDSRAGTVLNGAPLGDGAFLKDGDRIGIGGHELVFLGAERRRAGNDEPESILGLRNISGTEETTLAGIRSEEKLRALLEVGRSLAAQPDLKTVLARALEALFRVFSKAERGFVLLKDQSAGVLTPWAYKIRGGAAGRVTVSRTIFEHVMLHGKAVLSADVIADTRFGESRSLEDAQIRTLMCVPLKDCHGQSVGILQLDTRDQRSKFTSEDLDVLAAIAGPVGMAVENAQLLEQAGRERRHLAFLAEAGAALASSLDLPATLATVARLAVPRLADLCVIDVRDSAGTIRRVAAAHADPAKQALVDELRRRYPPVPGIPRPALRVLETRRSELSNEVSDELLQSIAHDAEHLALLRKLGFTSYLVVPLASRGETFGVLSLIGTETHRKYGPAELQLAEELARRAGQAIDNAALYQEARKAHRVAEEASRSKDLFLAMLSHELRTPLTPILTAASAHVREEGDPGVREEWEMVRRNVVLEARLIDDLLDLSRIERGRMRLDLELVDLHRTIHQAVETCRDEIFVAGLTLELDLAAAAHHVRADQARLMQVTWNLIRNAAKFTPPSGTLSIRSRNEFQTSDNPLGTLVVEFEDTGQGIEPDVMPRIFDAFEQGRSELRSRAGGLGLGLAISRSLVEAQSGRLTAYSDGRGLGSTFRLELSAVPEPCADEIAPPPTPTAPPRRTASILLVEDNRDTLRYLALVLGQSGHQVRAAANLAEARGELITSDFDLVVSDIEFPDGTGLELMRELAGTGIAGIAISGFGSEDDIRQSRAAGFSDHLTKPVDISSLETAIQRALSDRRLVPSRDLSGAPSERTSAPEAAYSGSILGSE